MTTLPLRVLRRCVSLAAVLALAACADKAKDAAAGAPAASATGDQAMTGMAGDSGMTGMQNMGGMQGTAMTGNPDQDFLRMMSDHHKGLTTMAHGAKEMKLAVAADAKKLDAKQDAELDQMVTMLEKDFKDPYAPKILPDNQAMIDALKMKSGKDYERTFYQNVVQHHEQALKMIDDYLPKSTKPALKAMAEKMKADQTREIAEFKQKIAKL